MPFATASCESSEPVRPGIMRDREPGAPRWLPFAWTRDGSRCDVLLGNRFELPRLTARRAPRRPARTVGRRGPVARGVRDAASWPPPMPSLMACHRSRCRRRRKASRVGNPVQLLLRSGCGQRVYEARSGWSGRTESREVVSRCAVHRGPNEAIEVDSHGHQIAMKGQSIGIANLERQKDVEPTREAPGSAQRG